MKVEWDRYGPVRLVEEETMSEGNGQGGVIAVLEGIVKEAGSVFIAHGQRTYALNDPQCPQAKVISYVKTKLGAWVTGHEGGIA